jgi:hypothetical protein
MNIDVVLQQLAHDPFASFDAAEVALELAVESAPPPREGSTRNRCPSFVSRSGLRQVA